MLSGRGLLCNSPLCFTLALFIFIFLSDFREHCFHLLLHAFGRDDSRHFSKPEYPTEKLLADSNRNRDPEMLFIFLHDHDIVSEFIHNRTHHFEKEHHGDRNNLAAIHAEDMLVIVGHVEIAAGAAAFTRHIQFDDILHFIYSEMLEPTAFKGKQIVMTFVGKKVILVLLAIFSKGLFNCP